jgi:hypothetical protein
VDVELVSHGIGSDRVVAVTQRPGSGMCAALTLPDVRS